MSLWENILLHGLARPRIVHSLPGRLRVNLPLLTRVPDEWEGVVNWVERVLGAPAGIDRLQSDRRTGTVLVIYDAARLSEADLMQWFRTALAWARRHHKHLRDLSPDAAEDLARRLEAALAEMAETRLAERILEELTDVGCA